MHAHGCTREPSGLSMIVLKQLFTHHMQVNASTTLSALHRQFPSHNHRSGSFRVPLQSEQRHCPHSGQIIVLVTVPVCPSVKVTLDAVGCCVTGRTEVVVESLATLSCRYERVGNWGYPVSSEMISNAGRGGLPFVIGVVIVRSVASGLHFKVHGSAVNRVVSSLLGNLSLQTLESLGGTGGGLSARGGISGESLLTDLEQDRRCSLNSFVIFSCCSTFLIM